MEIQAVKLQITNSVNDDEQIIWFFCNTEDEKKNWINEKIIEKDKWNYHTMGAVSNRYYYFDEYIASDLLNYDISELKGMKLRDLIKLIK